MTVRRCALDRDGFNALFAEHLVRVVRFVERRTGDHGVAEEIAADTFVVAWSKRNDADITLPWLYRTAAHKIGDYYKRSRRKRAAEGALARLAEEPAVGVSTLDRLALAAAMKALNAREREVIMLTYWDGLTARETGEVIGASESAVWVTLTRARAKMRDQLGASDVSVSGGDHVLR